MRYILIMLLAFVTTGCASYTQHWGEIPSDVDPSYNGSANEEDKNLAQIICAEGERQFYFLGTSKPQLNLKFTDRGFFLFNFYKSAWKLLPEERSFTLKWTFRDRYAEFRINRFKFEPNTTYYAKYSYKLGQVKLWIEKSTGEIVYGKKPIEGQF